MYVLSKKNERVKKCRTRTGRVYSKNPLPLIGGAIAGVSKLTLPTMKATGDGLPKLPTLPKIQLPKISLFKKKPEEVPAYVPGYGADQVKTLKKMGVPLPDSVVDLKTFRESAIGKRYQAYIDAGATKEQAIEKLKQATATARAGTAPVKTPDQVQVEKKYQEVQEMKSDLEKIKRAREQGIIDDDTARRLANQRIRKINGDVEDVGEIVRKAKLRKEVNAMVQQALKKSMITLI